jgi:SAM-dependent methyltransferase
LRNDPEHGAALRANIASYYTFDERAYINGAPHLKHKGIAQRYSDLINAAVDQLGRDAHTISVLELGAGSGLASTAWFERGVEITAVDSSETMLGRFATRAGAYSVTPNVVVEDVASFLESSNEAFDVVTLVSMIHHVPDYLDMLRRATARVRVGGSLITFADPLRYDRMPRFHHSIDRISYYMWRLGQRNLNRGIKTRFRRLRGIYSEAEVVDFDEYHVVRNGVDSGEIVKQLQASFSQVRLLSYWSTNSRLLQSFGERVHLVSCFGVLASQRRPA